MRKTLDRIGNRLPSPTTVIAVIALFAAGVGTATAARTIGGNDVRRNAVGGLHLKQDAIGGRHIKGRAIRGRHIRNGAVKGKHLARSALPRRGPAGPRGPAGAQGATGPQGPVGPEGPPGAGELHYPFSVDVGIEPGEGTDGRQGVECPDGTFPTGGSIAAFNDDGEMVPDVVIGSQAGFIDGEGVPHGWSGEWLNGTQGTVTVISEAICAPASEVSVPAGAVGRPSEPDRGRRRPAPDG